MSLVFFSRSEIYTWIESFFPRLIILSSLILFYIFNKFYLIFFPFHSFFLTIVSLISIDFFPSNLCCAVQSHFNCVWLFAALWTEAHQAPLSMRFPRQQYWSFGLPFPSPGDLPNPGIEPESLTSPALTGGVFTTSATWEAPVLRWGYS